MKWVIIIFIIQRRKLVNEALQKVITIKYLSILTHLFSKGMWLELQSKWIPGRDPLHPAPFHMAKRELDMVFPDSEISQDSSGRL